MKTVTIGRNSDNDKVIPKAYISGHHARVTLLDDGEYSVEDLNSTNGTYVNGYRILRARISAHDELRLARDVILDLPSLFGQKAPAGDAPRVKSNPKDFTEEFARLKPVYEQYKNERKELQHRHRQRVAIIRGLITASPLIVLTLYSAITGDPKIQSSMMGITILGSTLASLFTEGINIDEELDSLDENFRLRFVCPNEKCRHQLGTKTSWTLYHTTGACPKCGAIYSKEKLKEQSDAASEEKPKEIKSKPEHNNL